MNYHLLATRMGLVKPSPTAAISDLVRSMESQGKPVINLGEGELDFSTPEAISYAGIEAIIQHQTKYTAVSGTAALKSAIQLKFKRDNHLEFTHSQLIAGCGAKQLIFNALLATVEDGNEVIVPAPYWVSYPDMVRLAGGTPVIVPCTEDHHWKLTPEALVAALTSNTRWIILNSPNNPTGAIYSHEELSKLADVLMDYPNVLILSDDIYEPLRYRGLGYATFAEVTPSLANRTLTINGVSKSHAMTGWRLGYAAGPEWLIKAMEILQSQSTSNPSSISQAAAVTALTQPAIFLNEWREKLAERQQKVLDTLNSIEGFHATPPEGAFYIFVNCQKMIGMTTPQGTVLTDDAAIAAWIIENAQVAVLQGSAFGTPGYLRIAYAVDDGLLDAACSQLKNACQALTRIAD